VEPVWRIRVTKVRVVEDEPSLRSSDGPWALWINDGILLIHDFEESIGGGTSVEGHRQQESDRLHRESQHRRCREEGDECSHRDLGTRGEPHAASKTEGERDIGYEQKPQPDASNRLRFFNFGAPQ